MLVHSQLVLRIVCALCNKSLGGAWKQGYCNSLYSLHLKSKNYRHVTYRVTAKSVSRYNKACVLSNSLRSEGVKLIKKQNAGSCRLSSIKHVQVCVCVGGGGECHMILMIFLLKHPSSTFGYQIHFHMKKIVTNLVKMSLTASSLAPIYLLRSSGPCRPVYKRVSDTTPVHSEVCMETFFCTLMLTKLRLNSFATAPASKVFPVPGAPYSSTPHRCLIVH